MIPALLTALLCVLLVELVRRLPMVRSLSRIADCSARALRLMRSGRISDHWKEKAILAYAGRMFRSSLTLALMLLAVGVVVVGFVWAAGFADTGYAAFLTGPAGLIGSALGATAYYLLRRHVGA